MQEKYRLFKILPVFSLFTFLFSCAQIGFFQDASQRRLVQAYTPNLDLYVFRSPRVGVSDWQRGLQIPGVKNIANYLLDLFLNDQNSVNHLQEQNDMLFYANNIRIFYVTARSSQPNSVSSTYADQSLVRGNGIVCPTGEVFPFESMGLQKDNIVTESDGFRYYSGDLITAGYPVSSGLPPRKLYMTNEEGTNLTGPEIQVEPNHVRIFFSDIISPCKGVAGLATLGNITQLSNKDERIMSYASISVRYNVTRENFIASISHELGHLFGLYHSFQSPVNGFRGTCQFALQGTTNRVMDYSSAVDTFIPCEQESYRTGANIFLDGQITNYEYDKNGRLINPAFARRNIHSEARLRGMSTENQFLIESTRVQIYDADYYKNVSQPSSQNEISRETFSRLEIVR